MGIAKINIINKANYDFLKYFFCYLFLSLLLLVNIVAMLLLIPNFIPTKISNSKSSKPNIS